jgi:hypothetical protein
MCHGGLVGTISLSSVILKQVCEDLIGTAALVDLVKSMGNAIAGYYKSDDTVFVDLQSIDYVFTKKGNAGFVIN